MAKSLIITKQAADYFDFDLTVDTLVYPTVSNTRNDLTVVNTLCDFKTANGASIIQKQQIDVTEVTLIAGGTFTFVSVIALFTKLREVGYFDWINTGGGGTGVDRFDELLDTFSYIGKDGYVPVVDESQLKLVAQPFYNIRLFTELQDTPDNYVPNKMVVVNATGDGLIFIDQPTPPPTYLNSVGFFNYQDLASQTTSIPFTNLDPVLLTNDTLGTETNITNNPYGVTVTWNPSTNQLDFTQLSIGDLVNLRISTSIDVDANSTYSYVLKLAIGSASEKEITVSAGFQKDSGTYPNIVTIPFAMVNSDLIDYPSEIYLLSEGSGSVSNIDFYIEVLRKNINIVDVVTPDHNNLNGLNVGDYQHLTVAEKTSFGNRLESIVAGTNTTIDDTDPLNPIINSSGGGFQDLQQVTDIGATTDKPITVNNTNGVTQINGGSIVLTDADANSVEITSADVVVGYEAKLPNKTGIQTFAMLSDVGGGDFIPLSGTEVGSPITGDLEFEDEVILFNENITEDTLSSIGFQEGGAILTTENKTTNFSTAIRTSPTNAYIDSNDPDSKGLIGSTDFSANYTDNTYVQKKWVVDNFGGAGDMLLNAIQTVTALKTFLSGTFGLRNVANTFTSFFTNTNTASRTYTLQDRNGTLADSTDLALKANIASPTFTGTVTTPAIEVSSETASRIASFDASKNVKSLNTTTYPSLTELSYVKGLTSALQPQINAKITQNAWVDYSEISTIVGFSSFTYKYIRYMVIGDMCTVISSIVGTSNSAAFTFTLPFINTGVLLYIPIKIQNNSGYPAALGYADFPANSSTVTLWATIQQAGWTASNNKGVYYAFSYKIN